MRFLAIALFALFLCAPVFAESAEEMLSACKSASDAPVENGSIVLPQNFATGRCWGAFSVIQSAIMIGLTPDSKPALRVCAPTNASRTQLILVFNEYVQRNPKKLNEEFFSVVLDSLWAAFPCPISAR